MQRTRAALAAPKSRGVQLGNRSNIKVAQARSRAARMAQADQFASNILPVILQIRGAGVQTLKGIADALNARGLRTPRGGEWQAIQVKRIVERVPRSSKRWTAAANGIENLRHYVPDAELFKDHAGAARDGMTRSGLTLLTSCYLSQLRPSVGRCWRGVN
jgi:hypothetical protein